MNPRKTELDYLRATSSSVIEAIRGFDPEGVWVMQAWLWVTLAMCKQGDTSACGNFWLQEPQQPDGTWPMIKAYLDGSKPKPAAPLPA